MECSRVPVPNRDLNIWQVSARLLEASILKKCVQVAKGGEMLSTDGRVCVCGWTGCRYENRGRGQGSEDGVDTY